MAAPTGKAANRMEESILNGIQNLDTTDEVRKKIPVKASTIHRLLRLKLSRQEEQERCDPTEQTATARSSPRSGRHNA